VCLGNICRSPAADGIFADMVCRKGLEEFYYVDSAGTYGGHAGELPDGRMRRAAAGRGYDLMHRSRKVMSDDLESFDIVLAMDDSNYDNLFRLAPTIEARAKIHRMVEFARRHDNKYVPDPYYEGPEGFELVLNLLEDTCEGLLNYLEAERAINTP
jgi:protein-tyrosine phosphatase